MKKWSRFGRQTTELNFGFGSRITVLNFGLYSQTTVFIFGLGSPTTVLNFGFGSRTTALNFRLGSRTTEFNSGFGNQTTVLNFGLGSWTIAATSWRSDSSNVSLVVLDKLLFILSKPLFWKITKSKTHRQHLRIKSPRRRLKTSMSNYIFKRKYKPQTQTLTFNFIFKINSSLNIDWIFWFQPFKFKRNYSNINYKHLCQTPSSKVNSKLQIQTLTFNFIFKIHL